MNPFEYVKKCAEEFFVSLRKATDSYKEATEENERLRERVAELEKERDEVTVLLLSAEQCSEVDVPFLEVDNKFIASNMRDRMVSIYSQLEDHFLGDTEHLGQPYGDGFDAIRDAISRLSARVNELEDDLQCRGEKS